jgi:dTDP-4-dehydrorhamnose 3,5-epimerase
MIFEETKLPGSFLIDLETKEDERGFFARYYCQKKFSEYALNTNWVQLNNSLSKCVGTLRGLHFQHEPYAEVKLVRCIQGAIWDVIVDLREGSDTFGEWFGMELNDINRIMMYVPKGFAHGFITLQENSEIIYMVSDFYAPEAEQTLLWSDEAVAISWPQHPHVISKKDELGEKLCNIRPVAVESKQ